MNKSGANVSAFDVALNYITFKDRTEKEVYTKLKEKGYSDLDVNDTICKLREYGYINEENYALSYIKSHITKKSKKIIKMELLNKGLDKETVDIQLDKVDVDEEHLIFESIERRYSNCDFNDEKLLKKIYAYYVRRGFSFETIKSALSKYRILHENYHVL